jgi:hypothetical protein
MEKGEAAGKWLCRRPVSDLFFEKEDEIIAGIIESPARGREPVGVAHTASTVSKFRT